MIVEEGPGWRFSLDRTRETHALLLAGEDWAAEFTLQEGHDLARAAADLEREWSRCSANLMPEEELCLELERGELWVQLEGCRQQRTLRFVLTPAQPGRRGVEGAWHGAATRALMASLRLLRQGALTDAGGVDASPV
ncbi:DUF1818 family protein [Synechococcus sp. RSCCF101]|uniref:DUF1818 family protein n=1 Tax=Synechococcus sp. RSCCF101 TaxID=2511069 RepID=UPI001784E1AA|nr:DUF1818 family protein [Synechococcus sp. RSCCF101]